MVNVCNSILQAQEGRSDVRMREIVTSPNSASRISDQSALNIHPLSARFHSTLSLRSLASEFTSTHSLRSGSEGLCQAIQRFVLLLRLFTSLLGITKLLSIPYMF